MESLSIMPNLQIRNYYPIQRNPQQIVGNDQIINALWELQDWCGNQPEPMLVNDDEEEEDQAQQHQQHPYQLTPRYQERFIVAQ